MSPKLKAFLLGAVEALGAGVVLGLLTVWGEPSNVVLTKAGFMAAGAAALKYGLVYLLGYLRKHEVFREVWTDERRSVEANK